MSCQSVVNDFLSGLPSKHPDNFQKWVMDGPKSNVTRRPASYVPTKDIPAQQVIVTEKTNILLRYLHQQFDKKSGKHGSKRDSSVLEDDTSRKRSRFE
ncbi:DET1- and DDB1-associated protein 1 [Folsomia candida]|uniref:DET1- and DDB1-associated protein 1 n=1 Tax=Folsomia candida TaxID=158441 RepID=UPI000B8FF550|nr:DET1- and DDB1-associated protein 1 [Folsomia candida]XP_021968130.1 DET1- and DDB1-associated protein 1 [Folsomia candida]